MKLLLIFMMLLLTFFAIPCFLSSKDAQARALKAGFTEEQIERSRQFSLERELIVWPRTILQFALLAVLLARSRFLADVCSRAVRGRWLPSVLLTAVVCMLLEEAIDMPFGLALLEHARSWELTSLSPIDWLPRHLLAFAINSGITALVLTGLFLALRYWPHSWWLACSLAVPVLGIVGAILHPLVIAPLFNTFVPLEDSKWRDLKPRLEQVLKKAGVNVAQVLVVDASQQGSHTNAYFTGFGPFRQIVLYDTLLELHTLAEVETILAHELGHWLHHDIAKGILLASAAGLIGFWLLSLFLRWMVGRPPCRLRSLADPAAVPLFLVIYTLGMWVTMPAQNLFSRHIERQADEESLRLAGQPQVFIAAEIKLAEKNLSRLDPHPLMVILYYSHPPAVERIQMARDWEVYR